MGNTASVSYYKEIWINGLKLLINRNFHIVELNLYTVKQGVIIGSTRSDLIEGVDHLDDSVKDSLRKNETQVTGGSLKGRSYSALFYTLNGTAASPFEISESLYDNSSAQHIGEAGNAFTVAVTVLKRL